MVRHLAEFKIDDVLPFRTKKRDKHEYEVNGKVYWVNMDSQRYHLFAKSRVCACCGLVGTRMFLDTHPGAENPHFNLYAERNGDLVLMTKDHIVPRSKNGKNTLGNMQVLCSECNSLKRAHSVSLAELKKIRRLVIKRRKKNAILYLHFTQNEI